MVKYVALLRGIMPSNPNMRNSKLRALFEKLGFRNVSTVISSGNVLFESPSKDVKKLESLIEKSQEGFKSITIIRSKEQLQQLVDKNPFKGCTDKSRLNVTFLKNKSSLKLSSQKGCKLFMHEGEVCSVTELSDKTPDLMIFLEKQLGKEITTRTWKTVNRVLIKLN